jgi:predicted ribosomally synthesized peptide with SipW-like signal peptide
VKKIPILILAMVLVLGMIGGTFAYFTDSEESTGNTFMAGTMEMLISDGDPDTWGNGCSGTWVLPQIVPGANADGIDTVTNTVYLKRTGTITPNHLEVQAFISIDESSNPVDSDTNPASTAEEMAKKILIAQMQYGSVFPLDYYLLDADGDGKKTLNDITYPPEISGLDGLPIPSSGNFGTFFAITFKWIEVADDNDFQGDILTVEITFTLNQVASQ